MMRSEKVTFYWYGAVAHGLRTAAQLTLALAAVSCSKKISPNTPDPFPDLHIVSVNPSDNASNVATSTNVTLTFSAEVPVSTLGLVLAPMPQNFYSSLQIGSAPMQIISRAALAPNTTYSLVVFSAQDNFSDRLRAPFVSHFTTGSSLATGSVSGTSAAPFNETTRGFVGLLRKKPSTVFEASSPDQEFFNNLASVTAITDTSGAYVVSNVVPGTYWPVSALDVDRNGRFSLEAGNDRLQGYDPNSDFVADSVVVASTALNAIVLNAPVDVLRVLNFSPAQNARNLPVQTEFRLTFNAPLDTSKFGLFISPEPTGFSKTSLALGNDAKTLSSQLALQSNTSYSALLFAANSTRGQVLPAPVLIQFSTANDFPSGEVRGHVDFGLSPDSTKYVLVGLLRQDIPTLLVRLFPPRNEKVNAVLSSALMAMTYVREGSGNFAITHLPDGAYWPVAAKDFNGNGAFELGTDPIGYYDGDGDGATSPGDSVVVRNGNVVGNIVMKRLF